MKFKPDEIASVIRREIADYQHQLDVSNVGRVLEVGDGIAQIFGLSEAMSGEMLEFENGAMGQVFNLSEGSVGAVVYDSPMVIKAGMSVKATGELLRVPVGKAMLGRVIDPLGNPLDGKGPIDTEQTRPVEMPSPGIAHRQSVTEPLASGIKAIDSMTPMGRGQRELIIGDRKTGKTAIAIDTIINQKSTGVICVYVAIGQKESTVAAVAETLRNHGAMDHTIIVSACSSDPAPLQYASPYSGCAIAEHFMYDSGAATLVVYDDLTKHAEAYRQISLLLRRPPGREAYPGDVFYLHSRLLERACKLAERYVIAPKNAAPKSADKVYVGLLGFERAQREIKGLPQPDTLEINRLADSGGSMTALPICETQEGDVSAYIPTNLISITDGQIYLEPGLFLSGVRPAMNVGISVSRVGYNAAWPAIKQVAGGMRLDLAAYRELASFAQLGMDLDQASQAQLDRGKRLVRLLTQGQYQPLATADQVISIAAGTAGHLDDLDEDEIPFFEAGLLEYVRDEHGEFLDKLNQQKSLEDHADEELNSIITQYKEKPYKVQRRARRDARKAESDNG